jgi:hypothetical protein
MLRVRHYNERRIVIMILIQPSQNWPFRIVQSVWSGFHIQ